MISRAVLRKLTPAVIKEALALRAKTVRLEAMAARRQKLMAALAVIDREMAKLDGATTASTTRLRRWKLSKATRRKMSEAAKRRYAKAQPGAPTPERKVRKLSAAGRAAISAAAKARWERVRAAVMPEPAAK